MVSENNSAPGESVANNNSGSDAGNNNQGQKNGNDTGQQSAVADQGDQNNGNSNQGNGDNGASATGAPEQYAEFNVPEGVALNADGVNEIKSFAKEHNLTQESAQKIADLGVSMMQRWADQQVEQHKATVNRWSEDAKADKEIGGDALDASLALSKKVIDTYGSAEFSEFLNQSGLGSHPEMIRLLTKIGKSISEDDLSLSGHSGPGETKSGAQLMYPTMNQ